jgi:glycine reductase
MEKVGITTVVVTAMSPLAANVGANRIVTGDAVPHPFGDPSLSAEGEREYRGRLVAKALAALQTEVEEPTIFSVEET